MAQKTVDEYIVGLDAEQAEIVTQIRQIIRNAAPQAHESIKWAQPVYESNGPFCYIKAFKNSVNFGFWRGVDLNDPQSVLVGSGEKMRHVKITRPDEIDPNLLADFVRQAQELNQLKGDPTQNK
jgi:hypothetical protein